MKIESVNARVMPARAPMGRDKGGIQAPDRAFLILGIIADAGGDVKPTEIAMTAGSVPT